MMLMKNRKRNSDLGQERDHLHCVIRGRSTDREAPPRKDHSATPPYDGHFFKSPATTGERYCEYLTREIGEFVREITEAPQSRPL
jgi:hypothetical protein